MSGSTDKHFTGLTSADAAARLHADGPNLLPAQGMRSQFAIIIEILREPMLAMLLVAGVAYLLLGSAGEAVVLVPRRAAAA